MSARQWNPKFMAYNEGPFLIEVGSRVLYGATTPHNPEKKSQISV